MRNHRLWLFLMVISAVFTLASSASATTYYIAANGSDTNNGTSKSTPWAHLPGMVTCSANCASAAPAAGDRFILKGGDTWTNANLGVQWNWSGSSGSPIYIGVDNTWYSGSSWTRPVFDAQSSEMANAAACFFKILASYVTVDNIEMKNFYWGGVPGFGNTDFVFTNGTYVIIKNCYMHSWSHAAYSSGVSQDGMYVFVAPTGSSNAGDTLDHCIIDGSPNGGDSGGAAYNVPIVTDNVIKNIANGLVTGGGTWSGNTIGPIDRSFDPGAHENCIEPQSSGYIYNNVLFDCDAVSYLGPASPGGAGSYYIFNNVFYETTSGYPTPIEIDAYSANGSYTYIYNNTIDYRYDGGACISGPARGYQAAVVDMRNNLCIGSSLYSAQNGAVTTTNQNNVVMSPTAASAAGMTTSQTYVDIPNDATCSGQSGCPIGQGQNMTSMATGNMAALASDAGYGCTVGAGNVVNCPARTAGTRPSSTSSVKWDAGAYQFGTTTTSSGPQPPTNLTVAVQ